jgi:hypothetical protein
VPVALLAAGRLPRGDVDAVEHIARLPRPLAAFKQPAERIPRPLQYKPNWLDRGCLHHNDRAQPAVGVFRDRSVEERRNGHAAAGEGVTDTPFLRM